jgi:DNA-binding LacI/PurR family transcriptional regulator
MNGDPSVPVIVVGDVLASPRLPRVGFDEEGCGLQMAQALRDHGLRRIALWHIVDEAGQLLAPAAETRYGSLLRSGLIEHLSTWDIRELSLRPDQEPDEAVSHRWLEKWLAAAPAERPDCIWTLEDARACLLQRAAAQRGILVPRDLTICGADNLHGYHGVGRTDFPTTKPDYAKLGRCVVRLASDATDQARRVPTRFLLDLPVIWPSA